MAQLACKIGLLRQCLGGQTIKSSAVSLGSAAAARLGLIQNQLAHSAGQGECSQVSGFHSGETSTSFFKSKAHNRPVSSSATEETTEDSCTCYDVGCSSNIKWHESPVSRFAREKQLNQRGCVLWLTGLSGSGKSTVAFTLEHILQAHGKMCYVLDGDNLRHGLNQDLGFSAESREENIRRIGEVAKMMAQAGIITVVSLISPYAKDRNRARRIMEHDRDFIEVYMKIPIALCEERDPKGLYKKVREGKIKGFTGVDAPYEEPVDPEITLHISENGEKTPEDMANELFDYLHKNHYLGC